MQSFDISHLIPLLPPDDGHKTLDDVFLPGAAGPVEVFSAPNEVDDWAEAAVEDAEKVHGQMIVPGLHQ